MNCSPLGDLCVLSERSERARETGLLAVSSGSAGYSDSLLSLREAEAFTAGDAELAEKNGNG